MYSFQHILIFLLRISVGWIFLYAGLTKVFNPEWTAAGFLEHAQTFSAFFAWFARPENIEWVNFLNAWGITLVGLSLITGLFVRWSSLAGALLMLLYYFPTLEFPYIGTHSYLIEEHIVYALLLVFFFAIRAGEFWGLDHVFHKKNKEI